MVFMLDLRFKIMKFTCWPRKAGLRNVLDIYFLLIAGLAQPAYRQAGW